MGKSPGRWMKTLIFGKKSSRSKNPKAKDEKMRDDKEVTMPLNQIGNINPFLSVIERNDVNIEDNLQSNDSQDEVRIAVPIDATTELEAQSDSDRIREEQAATAVQAALRGYLARHAYRTLKGIIRLQALIRGHLVRRQAVSTLCSMFQIVKFQALARGRKIRRSDIGVEVHKRCNRFNYLAIDAVVVHSSVQIAKLSANGFSRKILASSRTPMPLHFHYDPCETNSVLTWLERWSKSHFWQPLQKPKTGYRSKHHKSSKIHTSSVINVESIALEFDKPIRNSRKVSTNEPANFIEEDPQLVLERVKRNLRKVNKTETETEKKGTNGNTQKITKITPETETEKKSTNGNTQKITKITPETETEKKSTNSNTQKITEITPENEKEVENVMKEEKKKSRRRVSVPVRQEFMENNEPLNTKRLMPSYMAATESAKAKLRGQNGPKTPVLTRRNSLPSLSNAKTSPKVQRLTQTTGKIKNNRSVQLSKDGNVMVNQVEWRR